MRTVKRKIHIYIYVWNSYVVKGWSFQIISIENNIRKNKTVPIVTKSLARISNLLLLSLRIDNLEINKIIQILKEDKHV